MIFKLLSICIFIAAFIILASGTVIENHHHDNFHRRTATSPSSNATTDRITSLPGLTFTPSFRQYSGYINVNKKNGRNIFYWYIESQNNPSTDPVVLWTNGGPACSGFIGLFDEHGPYILDERLQLIPNPYSWNLVANMLYVEQPVGTGFSYSQNPNDYKNMGDAFTVVDNYQLIVAFFERFPERRSNDFYISSESYGGHYMPQLALQILRSNTNGLFKFKGMMVGNPLVDAYTNNQAEIATFYYRGLIPEYTYQDWQRYCSARVVFNSTSCQNRRNAIYFVLDRQFNRFAPNFPVCREATISGGGSSTKSNTQQQQYGPNYQSAQALQLQNYLSPAQTSSGSTRSSSFATQAQYYPCSIPRATSYLNQKSVQRALHVNPQWFTTTWSKCSLGSRVQYIASDVKTSQIPLYGSLVTMARNRQHNLHLLVFSGDDDTVCPTAGTQAWIWALGVNGQVNQTWVPWIVDQQTAGYVTQFDLGATARAKFSFVTIHGAGHEAPAYRPKESLIMFQNYLSGLW